LLDERRELGDQLGAATLSRIKVNQKPACVGQSGLELESVEEGLLHRTGPEPGPLDLTRHECRLGRERAGGGDVVKIT